MKKIEIDNNEITNQDALRHKDFGKVIDKFNKMKTPFYKSNFAKAGGAFIVVIAALVIYQLILKDNNQEVLSNKSYSAEYTSPIIEGINFENIDGVVDSKKPLIFTTNSGSRITIPANTLVDSLGNIISGEVTFKYREFLNQKDIFLSGIPMVFDSNGVKMVFESGGMFELLAYQNDKPLFITENKNIKVELASEQVGDNFNIYYYSPEESKWIYKGKDEAGFSKDEIAKVDEILFNSSVDSLPNDILFVEKENVVKQLNSLKNKKPIQPKLADEKSYSFTIKVDDRDFPELTSFKGLKFEVSNKEKNFKPEYAKETWEDVEVTHGETRTEYHTCFTNQKHGEVCFLTHPVFAKTDIKNAEVQYEKLLAEYNAKKDSLKERNKEIRKEIANRSKELNDQRRVELNKRAIDLSRVVENRITRTFQIAKFGIWNSDCPHKTPNEAMVKANFVDENGDEIELSTVFLVLIEKNIVISFTAQSAKDGINYNPNEECMIWAVTSNRKNVATFSAEQFKEIKVSDKSFTFEMNLTNSKEFVNYSTEKIFNL
jgi:hypothetical protein